MRPLIAVLVLEIVMVATATRGSTAASPYQSTQPIPNPVIFREGVISTGDFESHPAFAPDGRTLYFLKSTPTFSFWTIVVSRFVDGRWTTPEVAPFSGRYSDADPPARAQLLTIIPTNESLGLTRITKREETS